MNHLKLYLLISLVAVSCNQTYKVTTDSMSNTFNTGKFLSLKARVQSIRMTLFFSGMTITPDNKKRPGY